MTPHKIKDQRPRIKSIKNQHLPSFIISTYSNKNNVGWVIKNKVLDIWQFPLRTLTFAVVSRK